MTKNKNKNIILQAVHQHETTRLERRPLSPDPVEAVDCLFKLVRAGMQRREVQSKTASHTSVFKRTRRCENKTSGDRPGCRHVCPSTARSHSYPPSHYTVDPIYAKNTFGRVSLGRNPVHRGTQSNRGSCRYSVHPRQRRRKRVITRSEDFAVAKTSNAKPSCTVIATRLSTSVQTSAVGATHQRDRERSTLF